MKCLVSAGASARVGGRRQADPCSRALTLACTNQSINRIGERMADRLNDSRGAACLRKGRAYRALRSFRSFFRRCSALAAALILVHASGGGDRTCIAVSLVELFQTSAPVRRWKGRGGALASFLVNCAMSWGAGLARAGCGGGAEAQTFSTWFSFMAFLAAAGVRAAAAAMGEGATYRLPGQKPASHPTAAEVSTGGAGVEEVDAPCRQT